MAINRISGNILQDNLVRGANLAIQGNLIYFDVVNNRVGVKSSTPQDDFVVGGVTNSTDIRITSAIPSGVLYSSANRLAVNSSNLTFDGTNLSVAGNVASGNIVISGDINTPGNITGGNVFSVNSISAVGNVTGGNLVTAGNLVANTSIQTNGFISAATGNIVGNLQAGNLIINNQVISNGNIIVDSFTANGNISANGVVSSAGNILTSSNVSATGNVIAGNLISLGDIDALTANLGNLTFANTTISTSLPTGNITLAPTGNSLLIINVTSGVTLPVGNTIQRPSFPSVGTIRYNTDSGRVEVWEGTEWDTVVSGVTNQTITPNGVNNTYTLNRVSTSAATLVAINGIVQLPGTAYSVSNNQITFTEIPLPSDVIDIRFL